MVAKVSYLGKLKKYKVIIKVGNVVLLETFTNTFFQAIQLVERYKGGKSQWDK